MLFLLYFFAFNIGTFLIVKYVICRDLVRSLDDPVIKKKFWPFYRDEFSRISIFWSFPHYIFFWPRLLIGWTMLIAGFFTLLVLLIGVEDPDNLDPLRANIVEFFARRMSRFGLVLIGYPFINTKKSNICYKQYLGPDWEPKWSGASTLVANHSTWYDGLVAIYLYYPALTVLATIKWYPVAGKLLRAINTVFIERAGDGSK